MKKYMVFVVSLLGLGLYGCLSHNTEKIVLTQTISPMPFKEIRFSEYISYQDHQFEELKNQGFDCKIDPNRIFQTHVCYNITGYIAEYDVPQRGLKFGERLNCGGYETGPFWGLFSGRNSAFYLTGDKVISMGLQTDTVYKQTDDYYEKILSLQTFWIEPKDEWFNEKGLNNSQYIQYIPFKKGETVSSIIRQLQREGKLFDETPCGDINRISVAEGTVCYQGPQGVDKNGEQNGQMSAFIFHPDKRFYYRYFSIVGTPQCEGYGFGKIEFFVENIAKTKRNSTYTLL